MKNHQEQYPLLKLSKGYLDKNGELQLVFTYEEDIKIIITKND